MTEIKKLEELVEKVANNNLSEEDKAMIYDLIRRRTYAIKEEQKMVEANLDTFKSTECVKKSV